MSEITLLGNIDSEHTFVGSINLEKQFSAALQSVPSGFDGAIYFVESYLSLPPQGKDKCLYVCKEGPHKEHCILYWNNSSNTYDLYGQDETQIERHVNDVENPHKVKLDQIGFELVTNVELEAMFK